MARLPINTADKLFWQDVRNAYDQVAVNPELQISIAPSGLKATIVKASDSILIAIEEANTETKEALIVPA